MNAKTRNIVRIVCAVIAIVMAGSLLLSLVACGGQEEPEPDNGAENIVNIGVTNVIGSLNPLLLDATEVNKYAISLGFLPLVDLNQDLEFVPQIASEITTEDNLTFTIKINPEVIWSDGEAVTADDVIFTLLKLTSEGIGNV